jgi:hypothetical protein
MPNIRGLLAGLMGAHGAGRLALWLNIATSVAVLGIATWRVGRGEVSVRMLAVVASAVSLMVSYHALVHDVTVLLPVVLLMLAAVETGASGGLRDLILLMMAYTILLASSVWPWMTAWWFVPVVIWSYGRYAGVHREEAVA